MPSKEARTAGLVLTIKNIDDKKREKELQRGFLDDGRSTKDVDNIDDLEKELNMLDQLEKDAMVLEMKVEEKEKDDQEKKEQQEEDEKYEREFESFDEAKTAAMNLLQKLESLGLKCALREDGRSVFIEVDSSNGKAVGGFGKDFLDQVEVSKPSSNITLVGVSKSSSTNSHEHSL